MHDCRDGLRRTRLGNRDGVGGAITHLAAAYFFRVLPWIAGTLAGRRELYRELVSTTHAMGFGLVLGVVAVAPSAAT